MNWINEKVPPVNQEGEGGKKVVIPMPPLKAGI